MKVLVVCDNTMGIPGGEIDDGLALLYLMGLDDVEIEAVCCTHGNDTTANTFAATQGIVKDLGLDVPVVRGADAGDSKPSAAAHRIVESARSGEPVSLLSLGAATDLAAAERLCPGCLAKFEQVVLMGGITHTLTVGGRIMDELNFSVDGQAACEVFASARTGARVIVADAWHCVLITFEAADFKKRLIDSRGSLSEVLGRTCVPWMEHARVAWNTYGFVGWDVFAAVAMARPDMVLFEPFEVTLNPRLLQVGLLERAADDRLAASIELVAPCDADALMEHVYEAWEHAVAK